MKIVGCDLHTRYQQVAMLDRETGELIERRLEHESRVRHFSRFLRSGPPNSRQLGSRSNSAGNHLPF